ncbi:bifunctional histidinol-phosphatase/imidazoleglycerol-phosphate dehydratase HisB [Elizabethkingia argentiflava]|uniref:Histidine biosynthesis bifunctional protein HisB n=1 Tax=Elizabethkingia argenteiflava TaxID=2681556 RepID=A0A845PX26_9FLAO|nr:bifunctional histidinol-phosphatase/imidazoleglycerol-phosphate dehydratase HisB [Elizabethkingia argenteiflava]NAW50868.1 bifunctional histidinol-phosphatase/imidazoleglycerol-phosphate dehydratase HisB [Elizabethkingia argenteiflava]
MKKILFIDRDGTLITEPEDYQVDCFTKLEFYPEVFRYLSAIARELEYDLVMVTNQDGLGTPAYPEDKFWPVHNFVITSFENEGVYFSEILIDKTFASENAPTRKPHTGLLKHYIQSSDYDLPNSFVIGDRLTDIKLAKNLGAKGIFIANDERLGAEEIHPRENLDSAIALKTTSWKKIYEFLKLKSRTAYIERNTQETQIKIHLDLDGRGLSNIRTGLGFFDHMLDQISRHAQINLNIEVKGDLYVDEHHTVEDTAIALGEAFYKALHDKIGIERYGFVLPMDDCLAQVAIDFSGRSWLVWDANFKREKIGEMPTEMFYHFFKSFADSAKANLNIKAEGENEHHKIEAIFKAFARAIKAAIKQDTEKMFLPSTKGSL